MILSLFYILKTLFYILKTLRSDFTLNYSKVRVEKLVLNFEDVSMLQGRRQRGVGGPCPPSPPLILLRLNFFA